MTVDSLFLENIEEFVNDENKIVTYKWLSQTLNVNCNTAKQMLFKYIDTVRNDKNKDDISATYFISGLSKPDIDGVQAFKSAVIPEEKLGSYKDSYMVVTSCHVYSVQKSTLKDSNALYMTDFEKFKENVFNSNKYSSIQCERAELRSREEMEMLTMKMVPAADTEKKAAPSAVSKPVQKAMPKSAIASMFAKTENSKGGPVKETAKSEPAKAAKIEDAKPAKTETAKSAKTGPAKADGKKTEAASKKSDGGMKSFFPKQQTESSKPASVTTKKDEKPKEVKKEIQKSPEKPASKKTARKEDSDDEPIFISKRRKTDQDLFASDSGEGEEMEEESECPLPPSPPGAKEASPEPEEPVKKSPTKQQVSKVDTGKTSGTGSRRIRKRKQVNKTYMDKDGFMVTEKVWESESTDASESEEPVKKDVKKPAVKSPAKGGGKKASPKKKPSPSKTNSAKQTSLTAFFKKS
ncbi:DNA polymerase delta subunit 3-like isoform X2 [Dreissena polymorpha]|nr:DNA polymerase delta subunit 3-like isoform X2 [Dreissena polymorpha]